MEWLKWWWSSDAPLFVFTIGLIFAYECYVKWGIVGAVVGYILWTLLWMGIARIIP